MVIGAETDRLIHCCLLAQQESERLIEQLEPMERARVLLLLLFVIILGAGLLLFAWLWGRLTRRNLRRANLGNRRAPDPDDWAGPPLVKPDSGHSQNHSSPRGDDPS